MFPTITLTNDETVTIPHWPQRETTYEVCGIRLRLIEDPSMPEGVAYLDGPHGRVMLQQVEPQPTIPTEG